MEYVFECAWFDVNNRNNGIKVDEYGFTLVNTRIFLASKKRTYSLNQHDKCFMWRTRWRRVGTLV